MVYRELVLLLAAVVVVRGQDRTVNPCTSRRTCGECIVADKSCGWCITENYGEGKISRCDLVQNLILNGCDPASIQNPPNTINLVKNDAVVDGNKLRNAIQIQPQQVNLTMRPNSPLNLKITFRQAANYPVDLYYLMDLSNSMEDDKENLAQLGTQIAISMSEITENFRLGFGSFVDKVVMPYVSTVPDKLVSPCKGCAAPYGFRNTLSLTLKTDRFAGEVYRAPVSGNLDGPEGGFDAIMQSIMCQSDIGWRDISRRLLIYSTDAGFHYAGDGKLGGIVKPNDGRCHLDRWGNYTQSIHQDYPSISQIAATIADKKVNLIFAVTKDQVPIYASLSNIIEGSTVGELADDSANIVQLVQDNYNKITSKVELNTQNAEAFSVVFKSRCLGKKMNETNTCDNLKIGDNVTFDVSIKIKECPQDPAKRRQTFTIYPVGLGEKINITVDLVCECECEKPRFEIQNSPKCSAGNGTYECGQCTCNEGRSGKFCECDGSETQGDQLEKQCIAANSTVVCSGRGECLCGECECNPRSSSSRQKYSGLFCQCDDFSCDYHNGVLCGGADHGLCDCGTCTCEPGFSGKACGCPTSNDTCMASTGELCNGKGTCDCGRCTCNTTTLYRGPTCEDCPTCPGKCRDNKACVQCTAFRTGELSKEECLAQCKNIETVPDVRESEGVKMCQFKDEDDCNFFFTYQYDSKNVLLIKAQRTKECPATVNILAIVLGVIGGIVAIGLALLLIWKLLTTIHDRREFAKFEKERQNAKWDTGENPIYKQATSTFKNPTYGGK